MKFCYCDETGTGEEPFAVLLGVIVDSSRMHVTKNDWKEFLSQLSTIIGHDFQELHTRNFYSGSGIWKNLKGEDRSNVIDFFISWFSKRKHHVVFSVIDKKKYKEMDSSRKIPSEIDTLWKTMAFHITLAMQKKFQVELNNKGNFIFIFDEEVQEETKFQKLLLNPPEWSDSYYNKNKKKERLCQLIDTPYFADSKHVGLLQVADFLSYFIRRYVEIEEGIISEKYKGEAQKISNWFKLIKSRTIPYSNMYPKQQRCDTSDLFWNLSPNCIRNA